MKENNKNEELKVECLLRELLLSSKIKRIVIMIEYDTESKKQNK